MIRTRPRGPDGGNAEEDFEWFYRDNREDLRNFIHFTQPAADHDLIADEAFAQVWERWGTISGSRRGYLFAVARNEIRSRRWARHPTPVDTDEWLSEVVSTTAAVENWQEWAEFRADIQRLPEHLREVVSLMVYGLSVPEIAETLRLEPRTVSTYLSRARRELRRSGRFTRGDGASRGPVGRGNGGGA